jgi:selenocysteine lyase/cysteine desulfurase
VVTVTHGRAAREAVLDPDGVLHRHRTVQQPAAVPPLMDCQRTSSRCPPTCTTSTARTWGRCRCASRRQARRFGARPCRRHHAAATSSPAATEARRGFAALVGADARRRVAILPRCRTASRPWRATCLPDAGDRIIVAAEQFPSNVYAWRRLAAERGADAARGRAPFGPARAAKLWSEALLDAIDERTAIVALPHVHWTDGTRFDLERIGAARAWSGATFVIDGTQSIGALPFDVARDPADACCARLQVAARTLLRRFRLVRPAVR